MIICVRRNLQAASDSHGDQLFRGQNVCCQHDTGKEEWNIDGFYGEAHSGGHAIADGYLIAHNMYDNQVYIVGKGRSGTTISAPNTVQTLGTGVLLQGTVTDQSPGQTCLGIPAAGTPAISDASMTQWMSYLYMQKQKPSNATGVPVSLDTIDPNGNYVHIGDVTSDVNGMFKKTWTPEIPGEYTIIATFAGSKSYFRSDAVTALSVTEAAPTATPIPAVNLPPTEMYIAAATAAIIVAIAVVGALILIAVRKRP
jgi:hypothetical protein